MLKSGVLVLSLYLGIGMTVVMAGEGVTGIVAERMNLMKSMATEMRALAGMFKAPTTFDRARVVAMSQAVATHAARVPQLFPEGSGHPPSKASAAIWNAWARFSGLSDDLKTTALKLKAAAAAGAEPAELKPDFDAMANDCQACHETYRLLE